MLNPYLLIVVGIVWVATFALGYVKGSAHAENKAKAKYSEQLSATIAQARENAVIDMQAAVEAETTRQQARIEFRDRVVTVEKLINAKPLPASCRISDDSVRLFNSIIRDANNPAPVAKPPTVPPDAPAPRRDSDGVSARLSGYD